MKYSGPNRRPLQILSGCFLVLLCADVGLAQAVNNGATVHANSKAVGPVFRARTADGKTLDHRFRSRGAESEAAIDLQRILRLDAPVRIATGGDKDGAWRFTLWTGEAFSAQPSGWKDPSSLSVEFGMGHVHIPVRSFACFLTRPSARPSRAFSNGDRPVVQLASGDELFGSLTFGGDSGIRMKTDETLIDLPLSQVAAVAFPRRAPFASESIHGWICRIDLMLDSTFLHPGNRAIPWIRVAVEAAEERGLSVRHSLLGRFVLPWQRIRRIRPEFRGTYRLLDAGVRHLGNATRDSFAVPISDGTSHRVKFEVDSPESSDVDVSNEAYVSIDIAELEPSGPDTLRASPTLQELQAGSLITEVELNGKVVGTLNALVSHRSEAAEFVRLRLKVGSADLKSGTNELVIRQKPSRENTLDYDDIQIRSLALERHVSG